MRLADSDWGPEADSGKAIELDKFPNSVGPNRPEYALTFVDVDPDGQFAMGTIPFVVDMGARKIYLADEGSLHAQLLAQLGGNLIGPIERGYLDIYSGEVKTYTSDPDEEEAIAEAVLKYTGRGRGPVMSRKADPEVCPLCDELLSECQCLSWSEGAEWNDEPIDQSSLREMKPGIQASRMVPSEQEIVDVAQDGECYEVAQGVQSRWPHLRADSGFFMKEDGHPADHAWNRAQNGSIVDATASQFGHEHVIDPSHPLHGRYVSFEHQPDEAQAIAHSLGHHDDPNAYAGICPQCDKRPWPGHEASLSPQQKAAAWDKPSDRLSDAELAYVSA